MVNHEFEWPEDATGLENNPYCDRFGCNRPLSAHPDEVSGTYDEDEMPSWGMDNDVTAGLRQYM